MLGKHSRLVAGTQAFLAAVEIEADAEGVLTVRPRHALLSEVELDQILHRLLQARLDLFAEVRVDLRHVQQLSGPWGVHFALCFKMQRDCSRPVRIVGLHAQPAALAWMFRHTPPMRMLVNEVAVT